MKRLKDNLKYILFGLISMLFGTLVILFRESWVYLLLEMTQALLIIKFFWEIIIIWISYKKQGHILERILASSKILFIIMIGVILTSYPTTITSIIVYFIGSYQIIIGLIGLFSYSVISKDRVKVDRSLLWIPLIHLVFGISSFYSSSRISQTLLILGVYLVFVGLTLLTDGSRMVLARRTTLNRLSSRIRIPLPVFLEAIIPNRSIIRFNRELQQAELLGEGTLSDYPLKYSDESLVHLLIQVGASGFDKIGHVDVSYKGKVYSYGNHDVDSHKLFGAIGDGVLIEADEMKYLAYLKSRHVTVFRYGIVLSQAEQNNFQVELGRLLQQSTEWVITSEEQRKSFMGRVIQAAEGKGYKFKEGRYKTYFVLGTNCVLLADNLLGANGINIINLSGILSPGSYYDYFDKLFQLNGSNVISKTIIHPKLDSNMTAYNLD